MVNHDLHENLAALSHRAPRRWRRWVIAAVVIAAGAVAWFARGEPEATSWQTADVRRGELIVSVSATGTLQPLNRVDVGSELSGTIASVEVDYNDRVNAGQVLARLDTELLEAKLVEARASLQSAQAKVADAAATVTETRLALKRCEDLIAQQMCAASELDKLRAASVRAQAAEIMAKAQAAQAQAALSAEQTNLRKAVIRAPIRGIVLDRKIEKGQTVAASFQTPVLFTLAEDLARMELLVAIDEADIGQVRRDQQAVFTVDAFPERRFKGRVTQIRQAPKTVEGVVTYETVLVVDNADLALLPGMTATADITTAHIADALLVPNGALRFSPPVEKAATPRRNVFPGMGRPRSPDPDKKKINTDAKQRVFVLRDGLPVEIPVKAGATDGRSTQILAGELTPGTAVVVDAVTKTP